MADYWKSQPKKFCQYCKCWIADNKPSVEFHERGKNHKENVAAKIAEIKKKSVDKAKVEERQCKEFAAMEAAAMKAYEEDMRRLAAESGLPDPTPVATPTTTPAPAPSPAQPEPQKKKEKTKRRAEAPPVPGGPKESRDWVENKTEGGHTYYYNPVTGDSRWEKPEGFQGGGSASHKPGRTEGSSGGGGWTEAVSAEGYTYFYHNETGESRWERPAGLPVRSEEPPPGTESWPVTGAGGQGGSDEAPAAQEAEGAGGDGQDGEQPRGSKVSVEKSCPETEPSEGDEHKSSDDDQKEEGDGTEGGDDEAKKTEEQERTTKKKEKKKKKEEEVTPAKRPRKTNPYGAWEEIQEEEDPYFNVDLQLPQVEGGFTAAAPPDLPPEPKPRFRERTITSLGEQSGPTAFRKSKTLNGRNRGLRQRADSDD